MRLHLVNDIIQHAHLCVQYILALSYTCKTHKDLCIYRQQPLPELCELGMGDLIDFECGLVVGLSISEIINLLGFSISRIWRKRKCPVSGGSLGENALLMSEVRGD